MQSILKNDKTLSPILSEINNLDESNLSVLTAEADINGNVNLSMVASSAASLNKLVQILKTKEEEEKKFAKIEASGIIKSKSGEYTFNLSFKTNPDLYENTQ